MESTQCEKVSVALSEFNTNFLIEVLDKMKLKQIELTKEITSIDNEIQRRADLV